MKIALLVFSLVINSTFLPVLHAAEENKNQLSTSFDVFNSKWNYTPTLERTEGNSKIHTKFFKRILWIEKTPVSIVDTSFVYLENPQKDPDAKKNELAYIAQSIKKSFGPQMVISGQGNSLTVEGKVEKINRTVKVSLLKKSNHVTIITSMIRTGLYSKLRAEVNELHNGLLDYDGEFKVKKEKKTTWFSLPFMIDEAHAAPGFDFTSLFTGSNANSSAGALGGFNVNLTGDIRNLENSVNNVNTNLGKLNTGIDAANVNWGNTNTQLGGANTNWGNTNVQIGNANTNWNNTNVQIGNANQNWSDTNKQMDEFNKNIDKVNANATRANENWADTNKELTKANATADKFADEYKNMNTNWAESNKLLSKALDPNHMAKVAFYTAAGAALGGIAVSLAIQGVSEGISFLHELFTGAKKKKLEWEDFEKAMAAWDNQLNDLVKMEQIVDNYIDAFNFFEGKNLGNDYVKQLSNASRDMRFDRDMFMEKFKDQNLDISCRKMYYDAADELDQKVKEYDKIIQYATNNSMSIANGPAYFCNQLKELQRRILSAETQMQDLRLKILVAENQYYGKQSDALDKRDDDIEKVNDRIAKTMDEKKAYDKKVMERIQEAHKQARTDWLAACMEAKNEEGLKIKEDLKDSFFLFVYFKKKSRCTDSYAKVEEAVKKRTEESIKTLAAEETLRKDLVVRANNTVEMNLSEEQMNWMSRVHMDAYCYQYAHAGEDKIPAKCKEFPELLYSLSLSKGYEKAKNAYQNKCQDRYLNGIKSLAKSP
ncbi:hypothetical protein DOM21_08150 [Bacteriovorax stolpii]|uniref:hypothetical protein n=1 Tax=Bacteriovorax stolpii TaxID=960 RepID=UPI0011583EF6|nr:hypothetical protein [Bacteriovorax stolpii]QDK41427.1 hypothetical protein DOM21_08150 [Bacteriovorax stolpii]